MNKTLRISFSLKNTYRVNSILYSLKQIPLVKKVLPETLYRMRAPKIFANVLAVLWEIISIFLGKFLYFLIMVCGIGVLYEQGSADQVFLHILLLLTIIGAFANTNLFNPTRDKYYAMILMRMDAREYTLVNYGYGILKVIVGFLPFTLLFGTGVGVPLWLCAVLPFSVAGMKLAAAAYSLWDYERRGFAYNENKLNKYLWIGIGVLLAGAYGLPAVKIVIPVSWSVLLWMLCIPAGVLGVWKVLKFQDYRALNQELLAQLNTQMDTAAQIVKESNKKMISADTSITSERTGFEYLNELFIKRHQKILWNATKKITYVCVFLTAGGVFLLMLVPEAKTRINELILNWLPYFVFIMYMINRGTGFTSALFMNCDHSLLTYSFYKKPDFVLKLFKIRLREIMKINAVPAAVIGIGLCILLFVSGGTENPVNYAVIFISILGMSMFFSVHYLTVYYLLQPYNAGTEIKSGTYQIVMWGTYLVCFWMMQMKMPALVFGAACILFCFLYSIVACVLVYRFAPRTFKLRP